MRLNDSCEKVTDLACISIHIDGSPFEGVCLKAVDCRVFVTGLLIGDAFQCLSMFQVSSCACRRVSGCRIWVIFFNFFFLLQLPPRREGRRSHVWLGFCHVFFLFSPSFTLIHASRLFGCRLHVVSLFAPIRSPLPYCVPFFIFLLLQPLTASDTLAES